jgi:tubulin beta
VLSHEASDGKHVPIAVFFELEPGTIGVARASPLGGLFSPGYPVKQNAFAGNNWAKGHYTRTRQKFR